MIVRNTASAKCVSNWALTSVARLLRGSYMVRRMPSSASDGLAAARICSMVDISADRPSSA
jgi:hypothetical protein